MIPHNGSRALPLEIWEMVIKEVGGPFTGESMVLTVEESLAERRSPQPSSSSQSQERLKMRLAVVLTCRQWAWMGIPYLYDELWFDTKFRKDSLPSILRKTPATFTKSPRSYGEYVKTVRCPVDDEVGPVSGTFLKALAALCPNLRALVAPSINLKSISEWKLVQRSLTDLVHLESLEIGLKWKSAPPTNKTRIGPQTSLTSVRFLKFHYDTASDLVRCWQLPVLKELSIQAVSPEGQGFHPFGYSSQLFKFIDTYGSRLSALSITATCFPRSSLCIAGLCRDLTFLSICPWELRSMPISSHTHEPHRGLQVVAFHSLSLPQLCVRHSSYHLSPFQELLESISPQDFPTLVKIRFSERPDAHRVIDTKACLPAWLKPLMRQWEECGIVIQEGDRPTSLEKVAKEFIFEPETDLAH
ncbi:hypothetical protein SISSUDRAFT_1127341 [Sistotremastrum suecicum HHB10207 ss-3]|uniref:F-box domain-containing protein n=1 Tax=Sistotremastrum suecicum HHB10207 ss-3 TaxID=1314776 RepID=A0A166F5Y9_9AGAM|nr:hypothetical protein SISSUDRAFT_1127341 [Sistotremastrum suecicum HHB10207 ss-3]